MRESIALDRSRRPYRRIMPSWNLGRTTRTSPGSRAGPTITRYSSAMRSRAVRGSPTMPMLAAARTAAAFGCGSLHFIDASAPLTLLLASVGATRRSGVARDADQAGCASRCIGRASGGIVRRL